MSDTTTTDSTVTVNKPTIQGVPPHYKGTAILRVTASKFGPSKTQNPMVTLDLEIVVPDKVESPFNGKVYALDSAKMMMWLLLWDIDRNGNVLQNGLGWLNGELLPNVLQIPEGFKLDTLDPLSHNPLFHEEKNPSGVKLNGLTFECIVESEENIEQRRKPDGTYEPLKDMQGNVIKKGWRWKTPSPADIIRLAEVETNRAF